MKSKIRENPQNQNLTGNYNDFSLFHKKVKVILWSMRFFWYKGLAKIRKKIEFEKRVFLEKIIVGMKKLKKVLFGVWRLISSRYDIKGIIYDIISNI